MAEKLHEQPCRVPAGAGCQLERAFDVLNARIEADDVRNVLLQLAVDVDQDVNRSPAPAIDRVEIAGQARRERIGSKERLQIAKQRPLVGKGKLFGGRLQEKVEWI